jgi:hypothetical protein
MWEPNKKDALNSHCATSLLYTQINFMSNACLRFIVLISSCFVFLKVYIPSLVETFVQNTMFSLFDRVPLRPTHLNMLEHILE